MPDAKDKAKEAARKKEARAQAKKPDAGKKRS